MPLYQGNRYHTSVLVSGNSRYFTTVKVKLNYQSTTPPHPADAVTKRLGGGGGGGDTDWLTANTDSHRALKIGLTVRTYIHTHTQHTHSLTHTRTHPHSQHQHSHRHTHTHKHTSHTSHHTHTHTTKRLLSYNTHTHTNTRHTRHITHTHTQQRGYCHTMSPPLKMVCHSYLGLSAPLEG